MKRYCHALDLINDPDKIKQYQQYHKKIWPVIAANIRQRGIIDMQIWQVENRLFMIMDVQDDFDIEAADKIANDSPYNQDWERLMSAFQQPLSSASPGQKWLSMKQIFDLSKN